MCLAILLAASLHTQSLSVRPASLTLKPGQRASLRIAPEPTQVEASDPHTILELAPNGLLTVQAPPYAKDLSILIRSRDEFVVVPVRVQHSATTPQARIVVGLTQSGASSADATLHYFFDFCAQRPISRKTSLWGNVRIATAPQQLDIPIAQFAPDFLRQLGTVQVNKLALAGEFLTGFEVRTTQTLGLVAFFGATGALSDPTAASHVFKSAPNQYLGLVPQDRERFYRQYGAGIRYSAPESGMLPATIGQDQSVTAGRYHRPVFRIDTFYPIPASEPVAYELAPDIPIHDPRVKLRTIATARDSYRIGFGIDLIALLNPNTRGQKE